MKRPTYGHAMSIYLVLAIIAGLAGMIVAYYRGRARGERYSEAIDDDLFNSAKLLGRFDHVESHDQAPSPDTP